MPVGLNSSAVAVPETKS